MGHGPSPRWLPATVGLLLFALVIGGSVHHMARWAREAAVVALAPPSAPDMTRPVVEGGPVPPAAEDAPSPEDAPSVWRPAPGEDDPFAGADRQADEARRPRVALIIDDWGYDWPAAEAFLSFPEPITVAVLPHLPRSADQARRAREAGFDVIVHMPMEPQGGRVNMGPGGITTSMDDEEIAAAVRAALAAVPGAAGLNNHMGSRATADRRVMAAVMRVLAEENLFFVDSYTAAATVGYRVARELAVPYAVNQIFLDHVDDEEAIRGQIRRLIGMALEQGQVVAIGHVRPRTYAALMAMLPDMRAAGIQFVPISALLHRPSLPPAAAAPPHSPGPDSPAPDSPGPGSPQRSAPAGAASPAVR